MRGFLVLNQPGVFLVDEDGNTVTLSDGDAIGSAKGILIAGRDGADARFLTVDASGRLAIQDPANLDVPLSTIATEATLVAVAALLDAIRIATQSIDTSFDINLSTIASEATLDLVRAAVQSIDTDFDVALSTRSSAANQTNRSQVAQAIGDIAHDAADSGEPVKIGGTATAAPPSNVNEGDRVQSSFDLAGHQRVKEIRAGTSNVNAVLGNTINTTVLAANSARLGAYIYNATNRDMFIKLGATASTTSFTTVIGRDEDWEVPSHYVGIIEAVWSSGVSGSALVTELTA